MSDKIKKQKYNSRESTDILKVLDIQSKGGKEYELGHYKNKVDSVEQLQKEMMMRPTVIPKSMENVKKYETVQSIIQK